MTVCKISTTVSEIVKNAELKCMVHTTGSKDHTNTHVITSTARLTSDNVKGARAFLVFEKSF